MNFTKLSKITDSHVNSLIKDGNSENPLLKLVKSAFDAPDGRYIAVDIDDLGVDKFKASWIREAKKLAKSLRTDEIALGYCGGDDETFTIETFRDPDYVELEDSRKPCKHSPHKVSDTEKYYDGRYPGDAISKAYGPKAVIDKLDEILADFPSMNGVQPSFVVIEDEDFKGTYTISVEDDRYTKRYYSDDPDEHNEFIDDFSKALDEFCKKHPGFVKGEATPEEICMTYTEESVSDSRKPCNLSFHKRRIKDNSHVDSKRFDKAALAALKRKIKDALEDTETTEEAQECALSFIDADTPAVEVLKAVIQVLSDTIDSLAPNDEK